MIGILPLYFRSLEHQKLEQKYGEEKAKKIGNAYGMISGWGFFIFWFGMWIAPQQRFTLAPFNMVLTFPVVEFNVPLFHLIIFIAFLIPALIFGIGGVVGTGLETAETHRAQEVVKEGLYSIVRHPQYFGGLLGHVAFTFLFSAFFSLLSTPWVVFIVYLISRKEEHELEKEFGEEYVKYKQVVPMLFPKFRSNVK